MDLYLTLEEGKRGLARGHLHRGTGERNVTAGIKVADGLTWEEVRLVAEREWIYTFVRTKTVVKAFKLFGGSSNYHSDVCVYMMPFALHTTYDVEGWATSVYPFPCSSPRHGLEGSPQLEKVQRQRSPYEERHGVLRGARESFEADLLLWKSRAHLTEISYGGKTIGMQG